MARDKLIAFRRGTAAAWTSANPTLSAGEPGFESDTGKVKIGDGSTAWASLAYVGGSGAVSSVFGRTGAVVAATNDYTEAQLSFSDITTNDVSITKHGFAPKAPNDTAKFLRGDGAWAAPGGGGGGSSSVASDVIWDAKGDLAAGTGADAAAKLGVGSNGKILVPASGETTGLKWDTGYLGGLELVYKYTVTGSDKASIDTGADTADAGTNDWTNGDLLEVYLYSRTDEAVVGSGFTMTLNNDGGANYDRVFQRDVNASVSGGNTIGDTNQDFSTAGASEASGVFGLLQFVVPNYAGTVGYKVATGMMAVPSQTASQTTVLMTGQVYRSTTALTRISFAPVTALKKFKVGTQLLIYKRRSA